MVVEPNIDALPASLEGAKLASIDVALTEADVIVLLVDHKAFKKIGHERLAGRYLVDTRGVWTGQNQRRTDSLATQTVWRFRQLLPRRGRVLTRVGEEWQVGPESRRGGV
jgi:hypothetical protein